MKECSLDDEDIELIDMCDELEVLSFGTAEIILRE